MKKQLLLACAALAACSSRHVSPPAAAPAPSQPTGKLEHRMQNCPSAVEGADTRLRMTERGVDIFVRAKDANARAEIAKLAELHTRQDLPGGPGVSRHCLIVHHHTQITMEPVDDGVVLHVNATEPSRVKALQEQTVVRLASMPQAYPRSAAR